MTLLSKLADRLILMPSTHDIDPGDKRCQRIATPYGEVETWIGVFPDSHQSTNDTELVIIKFPGTAGRAERAGVHLSLIHI